VAAKPGEPGADPAGAAAPAQAGSGSEPVVAPAAAGCADANAAVEALRDWFEGAVRAHYERLVGLAVGVLRDRGAAEDAVQEALLKGWVQLARLRDPRSVLPWLARIVRNVALNRLRRRRRERSLDEPDGAPAADARPEWEAEEHAAARSVALGQAVARLRPNQAAAIGLVYLEGVSREEAARRLSVRLGTLYVWLTRGLDKLADDAALRALRPGAAEAVRQSGGAPS